MTDIELHVEELVLHGIDPERRHLIAEHVVAALEPALAARGVGVRGEIDVLVAPPVEIHRPVTAHDATQIGEAVAATLQP